MQKQSLQTFGLSKRTVSNGQSIIETRGLKDPFLHFQSKSRARREGIGDWAHHVARIHARCPMADYCNTRFDVYSLLELRTINGTNVLHDPLKSSRCMCYIFITCTVITMGFAPARFHDTYLLSFSHSRVITSIPSHFQQSKAFHWNTPFIID